MISSGARLAFGGKPLEGHSIPKQYGAIEPTAVFVPLQEILKDGNFELVTTEVFGPVQASLLRKPPPLFKTISGSVRSSMMLICLFIISQTLMACCIGTFTSHLLLDCAHAHCIIA